MQIDNSSKLSHNNLVPKRTWTWMEYDLACMFHSYEQHPGYEAFDGSAGTIYVSTYTTITYQ